MSHAPSPVAVLAMPMKESHRIIILNFVISILAALQFGFSSYLGFVVALLLALILIVLGRGWRVSPLMKVTVLALS